MDEELTLFSMPYQKHSATSKAAAKEAIPMAGTARQRVYAAIKPDGSTDEEISEVLKMNPSTVRPRRVELIAAGSVVDSGRTRPTRSGRKATVWVKT